MFREHETEVLIAGAGPVGLFTALALAENGIHVEIIDAEWRAAAQSYACALHPRTLGVLDRKGLGSEIFETGRRIDTVGFYEGGERRAEIRYSDLASEFPFLIVMPQSAFENILEQHLKRHDHVKVEWNHRLSGIKSGGGKAVATIERLAETGKGYIVPSFQWVVEKTLHTKAAFVLGADGHDSLVRRLTAIEYENFGEPKVFAVFECECSGDIPNEARIFRVGETVNGFWPLLGDRCRWSFELTGQQLSDDSHAKERTSVVVQRPGEDDEIKKSLEVFLKERAQWCECEVREVDWSVDVQFENRVATRFGEGRCWLVGDSAHQTSPLGMQSMNEGLFEAEELAGLLTQILRHGASVEILEQFSADRRNSWHQLLGMTGGLRAKGKENGWSDENRNWILPCLPASGDELTALLSKMGLVIQSDRACV